jgi:hypothetical protein
MAHPEAREAQALPTGLPFQAFNLPVGEITPDLCLTLALRESDRQVNNYHRWLIEMSPQLPRSPGGFPTSA